MCNFLHAVIKAYYVFFHLRSAVDDNDDEDDCDDNDDDYNNIFVF